MCTVADPPIGRPVIVQEKNPNGYEPGGGGVDKLDWDIADKLLKPPTFDENPTCPPPVDGERDSA